MWYLLLPSPGSCCVYLSRITVLGNFQYAAEQAWAPGYLLQPDLQQTGNSAAHLPGQHWDAGEKENRFRSQNIYRVSPGSRAAVVFWQPRVPGASIAPGVCLYH